MHEPGPCVPTRQDTSIHLPTVSRPRPLGAPRGGRSASARKKWPCALAQCMGQKKLQHGDGGWVWMGACWAWAPSQPSQGGFSRWSAGKPTATRGDVTREPEAQVGLAPESLLRTESVALFSPGYTSESQTAVSQVLLPAPEGPEFPRLPRGGDTRIPGCLAEGRLSSAMGQQLRAWQVGARLRGSGPPCCNF